MIAEVKADLPKAIRQVNSSVVPFAIRSAFQPPLSVTHPLSKAVHISKSLRGLLEIKGLMRCLLVGSRLTEGEVEVGWERVVLKHVLLAPEGLSSPTASGKSAKQSSASNRLVPPLSLQLSPSTHQVDSL
jgi:hypothetical protein